MELDVDAVLIWNALPNAQWTEFAKGLESSDEDPSTSFVAGFLDAASRQEATPVTWVGRGIDVNPEDTAFCLEPLAVRVLPEDAAAWLVFAPNGGSSQVGKLTKDGLEWRDGPALRSEKDPSEGDPMPAAKPCRWMAVLGYGLGSGADLLHTLQLEGLDPVVRSYANAIARNEDDLLFVHRDPVDVVQFLTHAKILHRSLNVEVARFVVFAEDADGLHTWVVEIDNETTVASDAEGPVVIDYFSALPIEPEAPSPEPVSVVPTPVPRAETPAPRAQNRPMALLGVGLLVFFVAGIVGGALGWLPTP